MSDLNFDDKLKLLRTMLLSRLGDQREQSLIRQGKGWFHVAGMGHEALAVAGHLMREGDFLAGYYRDRPIALGRGMSNYDLALAFFAKRSSASGGRQMPAHYSNKALGIFSVPSVVAATLLPACGLAWGLKLDRKPNIVFATVGDAGTRQGDFFEAVAFAKEKQLPLIVLVEDNGIGISTVTERIHPRALGLLNEEDWETVDACDVEAVHAALKPAMEGIRGGGGPRFLWCKTERISSHSSADDHRKYRSAEELAALEEKDPINRLKRALIASGALTEAGYEDLYHKTEESVRRDYARAFEELDPDPATILDHVLGPVGNPPPLDFPAGDKLRMVDTINATFRAGLGSSRDFIFFGQDIEDPKGGVFSLTKGLSRAYPEQVFNSPLAESTILGVAAGLAAYGKRPVFEIQFTDFIWAGFNQLITNLSTLHWRTNGEWSAPAVIYAPYGAYLPGGAIWHSQANEAALAHFPGLQIAIPSTPEDAAGLFWTAMHGHSPTIILIPKHLMWHPHELREAPEPVPLGKARVVAEGSSLTIVSWGNCLEVVEQALAELKPAPETVEVLDVRSIVPLDLAAIRASVAKTGRLLVVHEDAESCSVGQKIIASVVNDAELFARLRAAPMLLAKPDVNVGYHPNLEYAMLPSARVVAAEARRLLATRLEVEGRSVGTRPPMPQPKPPAMAKFQESFFEGTASTSERREIRVPILGEGITSARVISLVAKVGDEIHQDDPLCEVETDKALFPIEASFSGVLREWRIAEGDEVAVDQVIAAVEVSCEAVPPPRMPARETRPAPVPVRPTEGGLPPHVVAQLQHVVPAHMTVKAGFGAIREARGRAKETGGKAPSPTVMIAWALVRAMKRHPIFSCTVTPEQTLVQHQNFDFGVAVALANDALDTAVIEEANTLSWEAFAEAYEEAVAGVRAGRGRSKSGTPLILTSMGGFNVRDALPVVVPPAIGTLFVGEAHYDDTPARDAREVVSLCLSFDHRWLNGVAGAQFLSDVVREMEGFEIPVRP
jgi:2-oxoisovalerate dehydrogenase E1 component